MSQNKKNIAKDQPTTTLISKSKYEFNMAEFPFCLISSNRFGKTEINSIAYEDTITGKDGAIIPRKWEIYPSRKDGWGSSQTIGLVTELMKICKEEEFVSPVVRFGSISNLIKRMGLSDGTKIYKRIRGDLDALVGYTFKAKNAFWDNEKKAYVDMTGHFFESVYYYHRESGGQEPLPFANIKISEQIWGSIKANALITIDTGDVSFHSFTPTEQRLALYLTKMLHAFVEHRRDVALLGKQLPLLGKSYKTIKTQITRGCDGLIKKGFPLLASFRYERNATGRGENIIFRKNVGVLPPNETIKGVPASIQRGIDLLAKQYSHITSDEEARVYCLTEDILKVCGDGQSQRAYSIIASKLPSEIIYRILSEIRQEYPGTFKGSRGSLFIVKAKQEASRLDIDLGFNFS